MEISHVALGTRWASAGGPAGLRLAHLWAQRTSRTQPLGVNDRMPGHTTHLPKEVGHHHVWKGLGPPGDLGRAKTDMIRTGACGAGSAKPPCLEGQTGNAGLPAPRSEDSPFMGTWLPVA